MKRTEKSFLFLPCIVIILKKFRKILADIDTIFSFFILIVEEASFKQQGIDKRMDVVLMFT